jgi:thioredoxin-related protein
MKKFLWGVLLLAGTLFSTILFAGELAWQKDIATAFDKAQKENKIVMVMVEGEHCRWCKKMKHRTLSDDSVVKRLKSYVVVKVMREDTEAVKDLPEIQGVPTIFFLKANKELVKSVVGYYDVFDFTSYINGIENKVPAKK